MSDPDQFACDNCGALCRPSSAPSACDNCGAPLPLWMDEDPMTAPEEPKPAPPPSRPPNRTSVEATDEDDPWGDEDAFAQLAGTADTPATRPQAQQHRPSAAPPSPVTSTAPTIWSADPATATETWRLRLTSPDLLVDVPPGAGVLLGRDPSSPIAGHASITRWVSSTHARIRVDVGNPDILWLEDLGSTNGTWVGGTRLLPGVPIVVQEGDTISLASQNPVRIEVTR